MITLKQAKLFAREWVDAWNARNLDAVLAHFAEDIELSSPFIAQMLGIASGTLTGKEEIRDYWEFALESVSDVHFEIIDVLVSVESVIIYYKGVLGMKGAEIFYFDGHGKVYRSVAHYDHTS
ncbi:MAG: nuclear transport factor 2 family protein [Chromatiales bacterium]|nr:nuclear transport factor 2 family protein [Chromatiales bacterium]